MFMSKFKKGYSFIGELGFLSRVRVEGRMGNDDRMLLPTVGPPIKRGLRRKQAGRGSYRGS